MPNLTALWHTWQLQNFRTHSEVATWAPARPRRHTRDPGSDIYSGGGERACACSRSIDRDAAVVAAAERRREGGAGGGREGEGGEEAGWTAAVAPAGGAVPRGRGGRARGDRRRGAPGGGAVQVPAGGERDRGGVLGVRGRRGGVGGGHRRHASPRGHAALVRLRPRPGVRVHGAGGGGSGREGGGDVRRRRRQRNAEQRGVPAGRHRGGARVHGVRLRGGGGACVRVPARLLPRHRVTLPAFAGILPVLITETVRRPEHVRFDRSAMKSNKLVIEKEIVY